MTQTQYTYNNTVYTDFYAVRALFPHVSWGDNVTDADLAMFGITKAEVEIVEPVITYSIYCYIASSSPTSVPLTSTYTPNTNEILMSTAQTDGTQVAKEDGTWVTPPSEYTVYKCVDGKLSIDVDATYANVEKAYDSDSTNILLATNSALLSYKAGLITESAYNANVLALSEDHISLFSSIISAKETAING